MSNIDISYVKETGEECPLRITIPQGILQGKHRVSAKNITYRSFEGVPYAKPPTGEHRFKAPRPADKWNGTLQATAPGSISLQSSGGSEDCLFLNVYTPSTIKSGDKLPVIVYIHGGGFFFGSSTNRNNPELFIEENVVLVTPNYRLGVFGFLSLNTPEVPGNAGMKDQVFALRWVKENIEYFGGDSKNVTILGESAGGVSCHLLQLSHMSRDLFKRIVSLSGTCLSSFGIQRRPLEVLERLAEKLSIDIKDHNVLEKLQQIPGDRLLEAAASVERRIKLNQEELNFAPVIETNFKQNETFLDKSPDEYFKDNDFKDVPVMTGYCSKEMLHMFIVLSLAESLKNPLVIVPDEWNLESKPNVLKAVFDKIIKFYFPNKSPNEVLDINDKDTLNSAIDLLGDVTFIKDITKTVRILANKSNEPVFFYRFSYRGTSLTSAVEELGVQGAAHADELTYLFPTEAERFNEYSSDGWVRRRLIKMITNFSKIGNPTPAPTDHLLPTTWIPVTSTELNYLEINGVNIPSKNPDKERMDFWTNLEKSVRNGEFE